jgi:hypothetical protein
MPDILRSFWPWEYEIPIAEWEFKRTFWIPRATLKIDRNDRTVLLRSNEQLVSTGGSRESPKHTYGQLEGVDADAKTATLSLGALHKIDPGDEFQIRTGMMEVWRLTITQIAPEYSMGRLEPLPRVGLNPVNPNPRFPERYMNATLIPKK